MMIMKMQHTPPTDDPMMTHNFFFFLHFVDGEGDGDGDVDDDDVEELVGQDDEGVLSLSEFPPLPELDGD